MKGESAVDITGLNKCDSVASPANLKPKGRIQKSFSGIQMVSQMIYLCLFVDVHVAKDTFSSSV